MIVTFFFIHHLHLLTIFTSNKCLSTMLKRLLFLLSCSLSFIVNEHYCSATTVPLFSRDSLIVVVPFPTTNPTPPPKAPSITPISANYEAETASVILYFSHNLGEIEIEVLNTITGYYNYSVVETTDLSAIISINGGSGHYVIIFTLPSGQQYLAELDT